MKSKMKLMPLKWHGKQKWANEIPKLLLQVELDCSISYLLFIIHRCYFSSSINQINQMEKLLIYGKLAQTPNEARKEIQAGRLKGMTDINPMWRIKMLTETFGVCGFGWKYVITSKRLENGCKGQISAFVDVDLFIKIDDVWSEAIQGTGGASFVTDEKNGLYQSDECFKMALTDALGIACKALGMSADIYFAKDRTKYIGFEIADDTFLVELSQKLSKCNNLDELGLLYDSLIAVEQSKSKALFTKRKIELNGK